MIEYYVDSKKKKTNKRARQIQQKNYNKRKTGRINTFIHMHIYTHYRKLLPISRQETNTEGGIDKTDCRRIKERSVRTCRY